MLLGLRRTTHGPWLPVVTFHRVVDPVLPFLYDDEVVDASPAELDQQIAMIGHYFTPIGIAELLAASEGATLPPNPILVTFDDGYRDNFATALPILQRHGVRAVFFIATHYLTHRQMFWWDKVHLVLKMSTRPVIRVAYPDDLELRLDSAYARDASIHTVLRFVKDRSGLDLWRFLDELIAASGIAWSAELERAHADALLMTWKQVRALRDAGMDVQSHTRTHRVLQTLSPGDLRDELAGSRADLERELDAPVTAISYPVGRRLRERDDVRDALRTAGYRIGFTNATGTHKLVRRGDPYDVSRIGVDHGTPPTLFKAMLAAPALFG